MLQGPYTNPSISPLSLDQSNQSDPPNGKPKPRWHYFAFNQLYLAKGK